MSSQWEGGSGCGCEGGGHWGCLTAGVELVDWHGGYG